MKPARKPGAQPGNLNAYKHGRYAHNVPRASAKHGFYAEFFTPEEIADLDATSTDQFLIKVKRTLVLMAFKALRSPDLKAKHIPFLIKTILRWSKNG
jgi:hypothetical protein